MCIPPGLIKDHESLCYHVYRAYVALVSQSRGVEGPCATVASEHCANIMRVSWLQGDKWIVADQTNCAVIIQVAHFKGP